MSENETISSTNTSIEYRFARARMLVEADVPVRVACRREGIGKTKYYELLKQQAPAPDCALGISSPPDMDNGGLESRQFTRVPDLRQKTAPL